MCLNPWGQFQKEMASLCSALNAWQQRCLLDLLKEEWSSLQMISAKNDKRKRDSIFKMPKHFALISASQSFSTPEMEDWKWKKYLILTFCVIYYKGKVKYFILG